MPGLMAPALAEYGAAQPLEGRAHHRFAAHDDPDRRADRNAGGSGRRSALGDLQHLLDAGSCGGRDCSCRHSGVCDQGRNLADYWDYVGKIFDWDDGTAAPPT
jgi:adenosylhomocysteinase